MLVFSDPHIHPHKNSSYRLQDCLDALRWTFDTAVKHNVKDVICLGDFFHDRQKIQVLAYQKAFEIIWEYRDKFNLWLLLGNHDLWFNDKWEISGVMPFKAIPNVHIIDSICTLNIGGLDIDFIPYTKDPLSAISSFKKKSNLLCSHLAINGAKLNMTYHTIADVMVEHDNDMIPIETSLFHGWKQVLLGHYHGAQILDGFVEYVGSPLQLNFSEASQRKHVILLDENLKKTYIENTFSPRHLILKEEELKNYDLNNCFLEIIVDDSTKFDIMQCKEELKASYKIFDVRFKEVRDKNKDQEVIAEAKSKFVNNSGDILERYVDAFPNSSLDKKILLDIGSKICSMVDT